MFKACTKINIWIVFIITIWCQTSYAQPTPQVQHSRVQYERFGFEQYTTKRFTFYTQIGAERMDSLLLHFTPAIMKELEDSLQLDFRQHLHIIIYNSVTNYAQTNIGFEFERNNPGGAIEFKGNRIVLSYKGSEAQLYIDLKRELVNILVQRFLFGNSLQEVLRQTTMGEYPSWFVSGFVSYLSEGFDMKDENMLHYFLLHKRTMNIDECIAWNAEITTKALLYYLEQQYGNRLLKNLLNDFKATRSIEESIQHTYKIPFKKMGELLLTYYAQRGIQDQSYSDTLYTSVKGYTYSESAIQTEPFNPLLKLIPVCKGAMLMSRSEDYLQLDYLPFDLLHAKKNNLAHVKIKDTTQQSSTWFVHQGNKPHIGMLLDEEGKLYLHDWQLNLKGKMIHHRKQTVKGIEGVVKACYGYEPNTLYLIGFENGKTELYEYALQSGKLKQLTEDGRDEQNLCIATIAGEKGILFIVNSKIDTTYKHHQELHFLPFRTVSSKEGFGISTLMFTFSKHETVKNIQCSEDENVYYVSNRNGVDNLDMMKLEGHINDSNRIQCLTQNDYNISDYSIHDRKIDLGFMHYDSLVVASLSADSIRTISVKETIHKDEIIKKDLALAQALQTLKSKPKDEHSFPFFKPSEKELEEFKQEKKAEQTFDESKLKPYQLQLTSEYIVAQLNNSLLMNTYQPYVQQQGLFRQAPLGGMMKYAFTDLFEDYRLNIGFRIPSTAKGSDFFVQYDNLKDRLDWGIMYFRHVEKNNFKPDTAWYTNTGYFFPTYYKQIMHNAALKLSYPFSTRSKVSLSTGIRYDKQVFLATDTFSLHYPDTNQLWTMAKVDYSLDRTKQFTTHARRGIRMNMFVEYQYQLKQVTTGFTHIGFDVRYYKPLYKEILLATKCASAISGGGTNGVMYVLGGTSNWLGPQLDSTIKFRPEKNYSFISNANNLRGYKQNVRTGNVYFLLNTELRIPLISTFGLRKTSFNSLNHLRVVPFVDIGNAWKMSTPQSIPKLAIGYGIGLHTTLVGYTIRVDYARPVLQLPNTPKSMFVIGLGSDF